MSAGGAFIRLTNFILRILQLCCSIIVLGIFSYFLAVLADHDIHIVRWIKAVEGLAGAATAYTIAATAFTLCIGGIWFFAALGMFLDICFIGAFIAIAAMTRNGTQTCSGFVNTPLGSGEAGKGGAGYGKGGFGSGDGKNFTYMPDLGFACRLEKGVFAVAIIGCILFALSLYPQVLYARHHKRAKRYGPSPANDYGKRSFWSFRRRRGAPTDTDPASGAAVGSYPLQTNGENGPEPYEKPPSSRYGGFFGRGKKSTAVATDPKVHDEGYNGYGNSAYAYNPSAATAPMPAVGNEVGGTTSGAPGSARGRGTGSGYANYGYGQSAVADSGYSHGYGSGPQYETAQFPVSSSTPGRNF
ncbi:hypothetical protein FQN52_003290 [Onygenales sp. PD_12]|nr:hypothetical protein FQN52_003290 [Onygenales sp. PD_12]